MAPSTQATQWHRGFFDGIAEHADPNAAWRERVLNPPHLRGRDRDAPPPINDGMVGTQAVTSKSWALVGVRAILAHPELFRDETGRFVFSMEQLALVVGMKPGYLNAQQVRGRRIWMAHHGYIAVFDRRRGKGLRNQLTLWHLTAKAMREAQPA